MLTDDFDGTPADETVRFTVDGTTYELDLSAANAAEWRETVAPWIEAARKVPKTRAPRTVKAKSSSSKRRSNAAEVRKWAAQNGLEVKPTGIVPTDVVRAYEQRNA